MLRPPMFVMNTSRTNRRSLRLREYDYGAIGVYFVTVCRRDRISLFGEIDHGTMMVNEIGDIVTAVGLISLIIFPISS